MKIRSLAVLAGADLNAKPGDVLDISDERAAELVRARAAEYVKLAPESMNPVAPIVERADITPSRRAVPDAARPRRIKP